ncbi:MAG TPA: hypothetical protein VM686_13460, partial [Polyangiaceae bacterium]|nr:hypothetical protein [Polyangiaceae bacterium]
MVKSRLGWGLSALALVVAASPANAAVIAVDNAVCTLPAAIRAANTDSAVDGCTAGSGHDTLTLPHDST